MLIDWSPNSLDPKKEEDIWVYLDWDWDIEKEAFKTFAYWKKFTPNSDKLKSLSGHTSFLLSFHFASLVVRQTDMYVFTIYGTMLCFCLGLYETKALRTIG